MCEFSDAESQGVLEWEEFWIIHILVGASDELEATQPKPQSTQRPATTCRGPVGLW